MIIPTTNTLEDVILDDHVYEALKKDELMEHIGLLDHVRRSTEGYAIFHRSFDKDKICIYLHRWIAKEFKHDEIKSSKFSVSFKNGNKLDCRISNLIINQ